MFIMDYSEEKGWFDPRIVPYQPITLDPAAVVFHYGQMVFEGLKAYYGQNSSIRLFRPEQNMQRLNQSNDRLCIPQIDEAFLLQALKKLIKIDQNWIPRAEGTSLYIRPFIIATEPTLNVTSSRNFQLMIILSPVGSYYKEGIHPIKILVENHYVRAVVGGTGMAKTAGNRSEEHTSELQSRGHLVCRLLLEKKKNNHKNPFHYQRQNCHQVQPNQETYPQRQKCQPAPYLHEVHYQP